MIAVAEIIIEVLLSSKIRALQTD